MPLTSQTHEHRGACTSSPPLRVIGVVDGVWAVLKARAVIQGLQIGVLGIEPRPALLGDLVVHRWRNCVLRRRRRFGERPDSANGRRRSSRAGGGRRRAVDRQTVDGSEEHERGEQTHHRGQHRVCVREPKCHRPSHVPFPSLRTRTAISLLQRSTNSTARQSQGPTASVTSPCETSRRFHIQSFGSTRADAYCRVLLEPPGRLCAQNHARATGLGQRLSPTAPTSPLAAQPPGRILARARHARRRALARSPP